MADFKPLPLPFMEYKTIPKPFELQSDHEKVYGAESTIILPNGRKIKVTNGKSETDNGMYIGEQKTFDLGNSYIGIVTNEETGYQEVTVARATNNGIHEIYSYSNNGNDIKYESSVENVTTKNERGVYPKTEAQLKKAEFFAQVKNVTGDATLPWLEQIAMLMPESNFKPRDPSVPIIDTRKIPLSPEEQIQNISSIIKITTDGSCSVIKTNFDEILAAYCRVDSPDLAKRGKNALVFEPIPGKSVKIGTYPVKRSEFFSGKVADDIKANAALKSSMPPAVIEAIAKDSGAAAVIIDHVGDSAKPILRNNLLPIKSSFPAKPVPR